MNRISFIVILLCAAVLKADAAGDAYYDYLQGMSEERAGNTAKALEAYEKAIKQDPQALQVYRDLAELRLRLGQADAAHAAAERVKELAPKDPLSFIFLGNVRVAKGDLAGAAEAYEGALKLDPSNLRALENLGNYYALTDPQKALTYYERYLTISPRDPDIHFQVAMVHHKRGQFQKASTYYKKSIELEPSQIASHLALADLYEQQKSTTQAIAEYTRAVELQPANAIVLLRWGNLLYRDRQWDEAWKIYQLALKVSPNDPSIHYWLARTAEERKSWTEAASHAEQSWTLSQDPQFLPLTAYYMTLNGQPAQAIKYLEKAREFDPNNPNIMLFLGMNYLDLKKPNLARETLAKGVASHPKDVQLRFHLGTAEDKLGNIAAAEEQFKAILEIDPNNTAAMNYLGYSWAERGENLEEAEKLLRKAVKAEPQSGAFLDSLGWVRFKRGDACEAQDFLQKAVMYTPDAVIYDHLGDAYLGCGHTEPALLAWSRAAVLNPKNTVIQKKLKSAAEPYLRSPEVKKFTIYLEGNFKQVKNLSSNLTFKGKFTRRLETEGQMYFERPDSMVLVIPATKKTSAVRFSMRGKEREVLPRESSVAMQQVAFDGMATLAQFFSGDLTGQIKPMLKSKGGLRTQFSKPNPSGGKDVIEAVSYDFVEGLWLPVEMRVTNATTGWTASLEFSDWKINEDAQSPPKP